MEVGFSYRADPTKEYKYLAGRNLALEGNPATHRRAVAGTAHSSRVGTQPVVETDAETRLTCYGAVRSSPAKAEAKVERIDRCVNLAPLVIQAHGISKMEIPGRPASPVTHTARLLCVHALP